MCAQALFSVLGLMIFIKFLEKCYGTNILHLHCLIFFSLFLLTFGPET